MDERGVPVCARGENRRSGCVASGSERGVIGSGKNRALSSFLMELSAIAPLTPIVRILPISWRPRWHHV